ncbi:MAG: glycosyltransferase family 2 protein [Planctomycetota bacterium]
MSENAQRIGTLTNARSACHSLDIVIPVYNEEPALGLLFDRLERTFSTDRLALHRIKSARYLFIDDGSTDGTAKIISDRIELGLPAVGIRLTRNFGHQNALSAGLDHAVADLVVVMDADLQDPPEVVFEMVGKWRQGFDVVFGRRRNRKEMPLKRLGYWGFYRLASFLADVKIPLDSGDFCLMDRDVVNAINRLPEKLRFPRGLRAWVGYRQEGVEYDRPVRSAGRSKHSLAKLYRQATDGIASMSIRPLKAAQFISFLFGIQAVVLFGAILAALAGRLRLGVETPVLWICLLVSVGNALISFNIYILGAYVGRTYLEVKNRPSYMIMEILGKINDNGKT